MRNLTVSSQEEAERQLRDGESLIPAGGVMGNLFFGAANDEDFIPDKEVKLEYRRRERKRKRREKGDG